MWSIKEGRAGIMDMTATNKPSPAAVVSHKRGRSWQGWALLSGRYFILLIFATILIMPFVWIFLASFKPQDEIFQYIYPLSLKTFIPQTWTLENYRELMHLDPFPITHYLQNSIFVAVSVTIGSLVVNSMAAYAFAKLNFPGRNLLFILFMVTVIVPFEALAIPMYLEMRSFGWVNSYEALIIPWIANGAGIFLLRQFFMDIPNDLLEAARIDGASHLGAFWYVVLPNSKPALITFALIRFQASWDSFFWPLIVAPSPEKRVIQVAIATFSTEVQTKWGLTFAASAMATVPIIIAFLILQRYYVRGIVMSGLKG
jgi:multiple sugar transport system permease protein